jgi:hypothetical protein
VVHLEPDVHDVLLQAATGRAGAATATKGLRAEAGSFGSDDDLRDDAAAAVKLPLYDLVQCRVCSNASCSVDTCGKVIAYRKVKVHHGNTQEGSWRISRVQQVKGSRC